MDKRRKAIEDLYRARYARFRAALVRVTGDDEAARDVVQEAFARALQAGEAIRRQESLEPWLWRTALRIALERTRERQPSASNGDLGWYLVDDTVDAELAAAVRALPKRQRLVIFLYYFADLSYLQIAEVCEISSGTVAATLAQARASLLRQLSEGAKQ